MVETFKCKRVKFNKGAQRKFILAAKKKLGLNDQGISKVLNVCDRTIKDWEKEKFNISLRAVNIICKKTHQKFPKDIKILPPYWYVVRGAKRGGKTTFKRYGLIGGDPTSRKIKWRRWWEAEGKFQKHPIINVRLPINKPKKSQDLAELVGIILGDGGISARQLTITLHRYDDKEYGLFVIKLIKKLFGVTPAVYKNTNGLANNIVVSRTELINYCVKNLGLKIGNKVKQQVDIPKWIKNNKKFRIACVRGLVDTDGSIYNHRYSVRGKKYSYKKISFTSLSKRLARSVYGILKENGLNPGAYRNKDVRLESRDDVNMYFKVFNSHNPKHLNRYQN